MKFWKPVYTWTELFSALKEIREEEQDFTKTIKISSKMDDTKILDNSEDTKVENDLSEQTQTLSESSETLVKMVSDEELLKETQVKSIFSEQDNTQTYTSKDDTETKEIHEKDQASKSQKEEVLETDTFDFEGSDESEKEVKKSLTWLFSLSAVIIASALVFVFYYQGIKKPEKQRAKVKNYKNLALKNWKKGDLKLALKNFDEAFRGVETVDPKVSPLYASLLSYKQQTTKARTLFEKLLTKENQKLSSLNGLGLSYLYDGQSKKALSYFEQVLTEESNFSSHVNSAIIYMQQGPFNKLFEQLEKAQNIKPSSRFLSFLNGMAYFLLAKEFN